MCQLIGEHFAILRQSRGWTQRAAARRANLSTVSLSKIENGECFPVLSTMFRLAHAYGETLIDVAKLVEAEFGFPVEDVA
jgi:transcriptional regulator with XRE-family HTH domain